MGVIAVGVSRLPGGRVLLQVGDDWHLVVGVADATVIAKLLHDAAHGQPTASAVVHDLHTAQAVRDAYDRQPYD